MKEQIIKAYSSIHSNIEVLYGGVQISFDGSQIMNEFIQAWTKIDEYYKDKELNEISFLEVGAYRGLWGIAFCEWCKLNNIKGHYVTVTMIPQDINNQHLYKSIDYIKESGIPSDLIDMSTLDDSVLDKVKKIKESFNIVFIDAGHRYFEVINDIEKFSPLTKDILLFHDIRPKKVNDSCGVYQAIKDSDIVLDEEIVTNEHLMGIGIKYI